MTVAAVHHALPLALQWTAMFTAFVVKPLYMILSLLLACRLRRCRAPFLVALKWAMTCFFAGELSCAVNYLFFGEQAHLAEYLHMTGMAAAFAFTILAVSEFMDERIVRYSDPGANCSLLAACGKCYKHAEVACSLRVLFMLILPCLIILCAIPFTAATRSAFQHTEILGTAYRYAHPAAYQWFENRLAPAMAIVLLSLALLTLLRRREKAWSAAKFFFAFGAGFLFFGMFRLILFSIFNENLAWFVIWEELSELLFVAAAWLFLLVFRKKPLLLEPQP